MARSAALTPSTQVSSSTDSNSRPHGYQLPVHNPTENPRRERGISAQGPNQGLIAPSHLGNLNAGTSSRATWTNPSSARLAESLQCGEDLNHQARSISLSNAFSERQASIITDEPLQEVIMAIDIRDNSKMGCAFYSTETKILSISRDISMAKLDTAEQFMVHVQPTTVLASKKSGEDLLGFLEKHTTSGDQDGTSYGVILRYLTSSDFSITLAHDRLMALQSDISEPTQAILSTGRDALLTSLPEELANDAIPQESNDIKIIRCGSIIELDNNVAVGHISIVLGSNY